MKPSLIIPGHGPAITRSSALNKHIRTIRAFCSSILEARENNESPETMEVPEFIFSASKRATEEDLIKWFRRTVRSWFKKV